MESIPDGPRPRALLNQSQMLQQQGKKPILVTLGQGPRLEGMIRTMEQVDKHLRSQRP